MKTREKRERLLVALHLETKRRGFGQSLTPVAVADAVQIPRSPGEIRGWVKDLEASGYLKVYWTLGGGADGGMHAEVTGRGHESAEDLLDEHPEYGEIAGSPTITYLPSKPIVDALGSDLGDLGNTITGSNEIGEDERVGLLSEIAAFEATLAQPVVASDLVQRFVDRVLKWLTSEFAAGVVGQIAAALIVKLIPFLAA